MTDDRVTEPPSIEVRVARLEAILAGRHRQRIILYTGLALILAGIFFQSYNGRQDVVKSERRQCVAFTKHVLVPLANSLRADSDGNRAIANDPKQSATTRAARAAEVQVELDSLIQFDRSLDPRAGGALNPEGKRIIRWLIRHHQDFSCDEAYPNASPVQFLN